jgi:hypothetical protein
MPQAVYARKIFSGKALANNQLAHRQRPQQHDTYAFVAVDGQLHQPRVQ